MGSLVALSYKFMQRRSKVVSEEASWNISITPVMIPSSPVTGMTCVSTATGRPMRATIVNRLNKWTPDLSTVFTGQSASAMGSPFSSLIFSKAGCQICPQIAVRGDSCQPLGAAIPKHDPSGGVDEGHGIAHVFQQFRLE